MYHVNPQSGNPGLCTAKAKGCPFGGAEEHFTSKEAARNYYEKAMAGEILESPIISKLKSFNSRKVDDSFSKPVFVKNGQAELAYFAWAKTATSEELAKNDTQAKALLKQDRSRPFEGKIHLARFSRMIGSDENKTPRELLESGAVTEKTEPQELPNGVAITLDKLPSYPASTKELFYSTPLKYLNAFASTHDHKPHSASSIEALAKIAKIVQEQTPHYVPKNGAINPPNRVSGRVLPSGMMQMQNVSAEAYGLLERYTDLKYGARQKEFWATVKSESPNYPKISDFVRAEKAFS